MSKFKANIESMKSEIMAAFKDTGFPGKDHLLHKNGIDNMDIIDFYDQTDWRQISNSFVEYNNSLGPLSPEAFQFYLPRYLIYCLENYGAEQIVIDNTIYSLTPETNELRESRLSKLDKLTPQQKKDIFGFLDKNAIDDMISGLASDDGMRKFSISKYEKLNSQQKNVILKFLLFLKDNLIEYYQEKELDCVIIFWRKYANNE